MDRLLGPESMPTFDCKLKKKKVRKKEEIKGDKVRELGEIPRLRKEPPLDKSGGEG